MHMRFTLSGRTPLNATYTNASSGAPTYRTSTPLTLMGVTTTASRVLPADIVVPSLAGAHNPCNARAVVDADADGEVDVSVSVKRDAASESISDSNTDAEGDGRAVAGARFGHLASIRHRVGHAVITFGGAEISSREHFKKVGPLWRDKACIGPDGKAYKWIIHKYTGCELVRINESGSESDTLVAKFTDKTLGILGPATPASLEIFPPGEDIVDYIFVMFLFIEKVREDRKKGPLMLG